MQQRIHTVLILPAAITQYGLGLNAGRIRV